MAGETDLAVLLQHMEPVLNPGEYVFCNMENLDRIPGMDEILFFFREKEAVTVVLKKETADQWNLQYSYISSWITLSIHSSLEAVGLTAAFANALKHQNISCNVVAAYFHDHIFVAKADAEKAMEALHKLSKP
ncbi:ACT domain-containing protein [Chryseobacterium indologenes]|uniref:ACT domain-containing protein n=1 Tax=Chryseobacterium indologenes TaxID=253 RepID=A0AAD0YWW5_CHRID|nr:MULTISPECIES: ACT domain-containing protein [Chryseobacterium]ASE60706.1 ACT domain-containing protein [Chryseobacterium indologenes]ATN04763.1 acetyltransferase [Chryseobacterium indologenes]AYY86486.1 ACT domain-containing protein [Chryseobacterium indologenes]AYZ36359.1 ACT domain-containing protein [Chryseobacterium indologenes]AZB16404.1 ACT domain-containing protein [Chryseobacterium indologenes]